MLEKKKILFIHHGSSTGGAFESLLYLIKEISLAHYESIICSGDTNASLVRKRFSDEGYVTCSLNLPRFAHTTAGGYNIFQGSGLKGFLDWFRRYPAACREFEQLLKQIKPDLVHFNSLTLSPYASVAKKLDIPVIVHVRESILSGYFGFRRAWLRKQLINNASQVIAICKDNLDRLALPVCKARVIYNPVSFAKFDFLINKADARRRLGIPSDAKVVLMTVTSTPLAKGILPFIEAMQRVIKVHSELWCLMPGLVLPKAPHPDINSLRRLVALAFGRYRGQNRLYCMANIDGILGRIIRCDFALDMEQWIAASDIVCAPHIQPHFSRTLLEAGAMKKPVVASRIGGLEECVQDSQTGLLVPDNDEEALAQAVIYLLKEDQERKRMGENNYQFALSNAEAKHSAQCMMSVYDQILKNNSAD